MSKRVIRTKYKTYELAPDQPGIPAEGFFAGVELPAPIKGTGAKVYHTADGPVIAMPRRRKRRAAEPGI